jgi:hypothetical protein
MINLTPHAITLISQDEEITIEPSGTVARVSMTEEVIGAWGEMPVIRRVAGAVTGLPTDGRACIVSAMVLAALPAGTEGVFAPDTGPTAVRNDKGHVVAVTRLVAA